MDINAYQIRREQWRQIINNCNNRPANITKQEWCRQNGVHIKSFYYWQNQFRHEAELTIAAAPSADIVQNPPFIDITSRITSSTEETSYDGNSSSLIPDVMIQTGDFQIYISNTVSERTLDLVMRTIRHA